MTPPRVFISYAWGDEDAWVEEFATRLRADGVDARLDRWELHPGDEIAAFMEEQVRESNFVLFICTPKFKAKADERKGGVGYEAMIATAEVMAKHEDVRRKFIPVHRAGDWTDAAASWLLGKYLIDARGDPCAEASYQDLLGTLLGRRKGPPPVGTSAGGTSPIPSPPGAGRGSAISSGPMFPGRRVLWVDDEGPGRFLYAAHRLTKDGHSIDWARTAQEAAHMLSHNPFDGVLCDQMFPLLEGIGGATVWAGASLIRWLRGTGVPRGAPTGIGRRRRFIFAAGLPVPKHNANIPVAIVSAYRHDKVEAALAEVADIGPIVYIGKPFDLDAIRRALSLGPLPTDK